MIAEIDVTSLAEVWIEIENGNQYAQYQLSLPLRKCGLKFFTIKRISRQFKVTSLAEVWIEISRFH